MMPAIEIDKSRIAAFCRKWKITELALFGSVLRDNFRPDSDVDVLVSFSDDAEWGLLDHVTMEEELSALLGRKAEIRTAADLSRYFRDEVVAGAEVQYEER